MGERPIIFSAPMVRAILAGRKTQTRRILAGGKIAEDISSETAEDLELRGWETFRRHDDALCAAKLPFAVGDLLWVRESAHIDGKEVNYMADFPGDPRGLGWRPSIHMPRWASRITLKVTGVKVERLNEISEADAMAEGAAPFTGALQSYRTGFFNIWESIHGRGSWEANPWVAAISFERLAPSVDGGKG